MIFGEWGEVNARLDEDGAGERTIRISHPNLHGAGVVRTKKQATSIALWLMQHAEQLPDGPARPESSPEPMPARERARIEAHQHGIDCAGGPFCRCGTAAP